MLDLADSGQHIGGEDSQQEDPHPAAEIAGGVGDGGVHSGGGKEEDHRRFQGFGVHLPWTDGDGDGGDQGCVADHRAYGVAVGDLSVASQGGGGRDHDLRQGGADGDHGGPHQQLRHGEAVGDVHRPVYEPVPSLDEAQEAYGK